MQDKGELLHWLRTDWNTCLTFPKSTFNRPGQANTALLGVPFSACTVSHQVSWPKTSVWMIQATGLKNIQAAGSPGSLEVWTETIFSLNRHDVRRAKQSARAMTWSLPDDQMTSTVVVLTVLNEIMELAWFKESGAVLLHVQHYKLFKIRFCSVAGQKLVHLSLIHIWRCRRWP